MNTPPQTPPTTQVAFAHAERLSDTLTAVKDELTRVLNAGRAERYFTQAIARALYQLTATVSEALEFYNTPEAINERMASDDAARDSMLLGYDFVIIDGDTHLQHGEDYHREITLCRVSTHRHDLHYANDWPGGKLCWDCGFLFAQAMLVPDASSTPPKLTVVNGTDSDPASDEERPQ